MSSEDDRQYFSLRKQGKVYISKVFSFDARNPEKVRQVRIVFDGSDSVLLGELEGAICLRLTGNTRKTQVTALVTQDDKKVRRLSLQTFKNRANGDLQGLQKDEFTFRQDEFNRLLEFLSHLDFINLENQNNFQIEDLSSGVGSKAIVDATDRDLIARIKALSAGQRATMLSSLAESLTSEDIDILLGRRKALREFEENISRDLEELEWQDYFEREQWVFGYGLDYRVMRPFGREMVVGRGGTDNRDKPIVDFLMTLTDYSVLVEVKRPNTNIFKAGRGGRAGTWEFSSEFTSSASQILEQRAEWLAFSESGDHFNKQGERLRARARNTKTILVVGSSSEFTKGRTEKESQIMADTFELFRRETRSIDIIMFDELLERARFIVTRR